MWENILPISVIQQSLNVITHISLKGNQEEDQTIEVGVLMTEAGDGSGEAMNKEYKYLDPEVQKLEEPINGFLSEYLGFEFQLCNANFGLVISSTNKGLCCFFLNF